MPLINVVTFLEKKLLNFTKCLAPEMWLMTATSRVIVKIKCYNGCENSVNFSKL